MKSKGKIIYFPSFIPPFFKISFPPTNNRLNTKHINMGNISFNIELSYNNQKNNILIGIIIKDSPINKKEKNSSP